MKDALCKLRSLRVKRLTITPDLLLELLYVSPEGELCDRGELTVADGIPNQCRALRASLDHSGNISLLIESEEFDSVMEGMPVPELVPHYTINPAPDVWLVVEKGTEQVVCACWDAKGALREKNKCAVDCSVYKVPFFANTETQVYPIRT